MVGLHDCLLSPHLDGMVRRGETRYAVCVATNISQARLVLNAARSIVEASPVLSGLLSSATRGRVEVYFGFGREDMFRVFPCSSRSGRVIDFAADHGPVRRLLSE